ncbi:MAG: glycosyl hydrolase, partial [Leeuwenhoekiella sp.]
DGGANWTKITSESIKGIPAKAFVNDIRADLFDAGTVYAALDNHKTGDFKPYLIKSTDKGKTWTSIKGDLPERTIVWRIVQDEKNKNLLFAATEFGVYFTSNGGKNWVELTGGVGQIAFRDIKIQRDAGDLVAGSFGRGIYILDDIEPLRSFDTSVMNEDATLFKVKPAYHFTQRSDAGGQGDTEYAGENPPYGAVFTYYMADNLKSHKEERKAKEKDADNVKFPGWDEIETEVREQDPAIMLTVKDSNGEVVNTVKGTNKKGFNRVNWELDYADRSGVKLENPEGAGDRGYFRYSMMASPGDYTVTLSKLVDGKMTQLGEPQSFKVIPLQEGALPGASQADIDAFRTDFQTFQQDITATNIVLDKSIKRVKAMKVALDRSKKPSSQLYSTIYDTREKLMDIDQQLNGDQTKEIIGEHGDPTPGSGTRIGMMALNTSYGPTENHKAAFAYAQKQLSAVKSQLKQIDNVVLSQLEQRLKAAGAPWIEGDGLIEN